MANLVVSSACNLQCAYCFASDYLHTARPDARFISLAAFENRLDFLDRSGIETIRLIGGEPTLHPQFAELLAHAQRRGKHILVFTHGLLAEASLRALEVLAPEACTVLVNLTASADPAGPTPAEQQRRQEVLRRLGARALPGFTVSHPVALPDYLLPLMQDTATRPRLRLGLALPAVVGRNASLAPRYYPLAGQHIVKFAERAARVGIRLEFDCGFVRCMFSDADVETMRQAGTDVGWRCNPVLDIGLDDQVLPCFPLAGQAQATLTETISAAELRADLTAQLHPYRQAGIYRECSSCLHKQQGLCPGGCLALTRRRFRPAGIRMSVPVKTISNSPRTM